MQVYDISVTFTRRVQVVNFEPAEATVSLKAQLKEGEDHNGLVEKLIEDAKGGVRLALKGKSAAGQTTAVTTKTEAVDAPDEAPAPAPARRGRPVGSTKKTEPAAAPEASDFEDAPPKAAAPKPAAPKAAPPPPPVEDDEFGPEEAASEDDFSEAEKAMTTKELQEQLSALVNSKAIDASSVKAVLQKYGATRSAETKDGDRAKILDEVRTLIAAKKK